MDLLGDGRAPPRPPCCVLATRSGQATLAFRLRAINVPLRQASKRHSRPLRTAKLAGNQAQTPWVQTVPKLTVRVRFPSPAPHAPYAEKCCDTYELGAISHLKRRPSASEFSTRAMTACHYPCGRDCQLIGVSGPDTLSYGLTRRGRHDRETVGHESAGTSRPRPIASAMARVGTSRSVAVRPSARPTTLEGVTSGRPVPAGSPRRLKPPAIGEGEIERCRAPPRMHLGCLGGSASPAKSGKRLSAFSRGAKGTRCR